MFYDFEIEEIKEKFPEEEINLEEDLDDFELEGEQYIFSNNRFKYLFSNFKIWSIGFGSGRLPCNQSTRL